MHLTEVFRELFYEKTRIILTIFAIAWGTFAIASMLSIGEGLRLTFARAVANAGTNLLTISSGKTSKKFRGTRANVTINLMKKDYQSIAKLPNIAAVTYQYGFATKLTYQQKNTLTNIQAVEPQYSNIHVIKTEPPGRFINATDIAKRSKVIVLGTQSSKELFPDQARTPLGKYVLIKDYPFLVIGVMRKKPQFIATEQPDEYLNWIPATTYELLANPTSIGQISVTYKDLNQLEQTKTSMQKVIAMNHGVNPNDPDVLEIVDLAKMQKTINVFFTGMQVFLGIIGSLTLIIAAIGIANVMYASVRRATSQIGVRMAIGAKTHQVIAHYIAESLIATFIGGIIGLTGAILLVYGIAQIPMHGKFIDVIGKPHPELSALVISIVITILGLVGFFAGLFPALKAAKIDPATALIYE